MRMKFYSLILFVATLSVSPLIAQTQYQTVSGEPYKLADGSNSKSQIFYSEGKMYVDGNTGTTLFVQGSMLFKEGAKITQQGVTALTGDFVLLNTSAKNTDVPRKYLFDLNGLSLTNNNLFNPEGYKSNVNDYFNKGVVKFVGKYNQQDIYALYSSVSNPTVADFKLNINSEDRQLGFIANFPKIQIEKDTYAFTASADHESDGMPKLSLSTLSFSPALTPGTKYDPRKAGFVNVNDNVAVSVNQLELYGSNRFKANANSRGLVSGSGTTTADKATWYKLNYSYLDINKLVGDTKTSSSGAPGGYSEFGMKLYDYTAGVDIAQTDDKVIKTNTYAIPNAQMPYAPGENVQTNATFLRGLTSPFETLRADYLFFHVLSKPNQYSPDSYEGVIAPPSTEVKKGEAYYFAMDASRQYFQDIVDIRSLPANSWTYRARGGVDFSRFLRTYDVNKLIPTNAKYANLNVKSANPAAGNYEAQRFISSSVEVDVDVRESTESEVATHLAGAITLLANPYLTPINLTPILDGGVAATQSFPIKYGTVEMPNVKVVTELTKTELTKAKNNNELLLRSRYWVMNTGLILSSDANKYYYNIKYDLLDMNSSGSTVGSLSNRVVQPLQVFAIQSATSGKFTFMPEMKVATGKPIETVFKTNFATKAQYAMTEEDIDNNETEEEIIPDWFFIQSLSKDGGDFSVDRTAVRFFSDGKVNYDGIHDVVKNIAYNPSLDANSSETLTKQGRNAVDAAKQEIRPYNVLYTEKTKNVPLIASSGKAGLTKELPLYYLPAKDKEEVTLSFHGLDGLDQIKQVYLVDRHELDANNKPVRMKLEEGSVYSFTSYSEAETAEKANRFILLFDEDNDDNSLVVNDSPISTYYSGSTLYINGLTNKDISSVVQIYDMQGRLMGSTKVNNYPTMEYFKPLGLGTFIVKIVGARNYDSKFVNTQNY